MPGGRQSIVAAYGYERPSREDARAMCAISAVLAAEANVICEALVAALERDGRVWVAETAGSAEAAVAAVRRANPDVVLIQLPVAQGLIAVRAIRAVALTARLVAFGVPDDEREILAWAEAGVLGCLDRTVALGELVDAIEKVAHSEACCSSAVAATLFRRVSAVARARLVGPETRSPLTPREADILPLVARGLSNKEIAAALSLTVPTVKNHLHRIYRKLGIRRRAETTAWVDPAAAATAAATNSR